MALQIPVDTGFQPATTDTDVWLATAAYVRLRPLPWPDVALRGDFFWDGAPVDPSATSAS